MISPLVEDKVKEEVVAPLEEDAAKDSDEDEDYDDYLDKLEQEANKQ